MADFEGQLSPAERQLITDAVCHAPRTPLIVIEVGTWLGGGSTLHFLQAMEKNGAGHLWGVEADHAIYDRMMENLRKHAPDLLHRFTPLFGLSEDVLPEWIAQRPKPLVIDIVFLDGGDNPLEQVREFEILDPFLPVGAQLFSHDARKRKGKYFVPFLLRLDNWQVEVHDFSENGILAARKISGQPSPASLRDAQARLRQIRRSSLELLARFAPKSVKGRLLRLMPRAIFDRLYQGSK
jgi:hypothetical protein